MFRTLLLLLALLSAVSGATSTWDGGGTDNDWTTAANWVGNVAPSAGDTLVFDATGVGARPSPNNDFAAGTAFTISITVGGYNLTGNRVTVGSDVTVSNPTGTSTISLVIGGTGGLSKSGAGTLVLSGRNTFTGVTTLTAGVLSVGVIGNGGGLGGNLSGATNAAANLVFAGGTLKYTGVTAVTDRGFTINAGQTATFEVSTAATTLTISGSTPATTGGLTKIGAGTLALGGTNLHTGVTTLGAGTLSVGTIGDGGSTSGNLSAATNDAANLVFSGGTLLYTGATASTDRNFTLTAATTGIISVGTAATALTLTGTATATTGALTKTGSGTLILAGVNPYTGATAVQGGTLQLTGQLTGSTALTISGGGILDLNSSADCLLDTLVVTMQGGTLQMIAPADTSRAETIGQVQISSGFNQITLTGNGTGNAQLTASTNPGYTRTSPATLLYNRTNGSPGTANLFLTGVADTTALTWSTVSQAGSTSPGVYSTANGLVGNGAGDIVSFQSGNWNDGTTWVGGVAPAAGNTATIASNHVVALNGADRTIAGLQFTGGGSLSLGNKLIVSGGGIIVSGSGSPTIASDIQIGAADGTIQQGSSGTLTISGTVTVGAATSRLMKTGSGTLVLSGTNTFTCGTIQVGAGTLSFGANTNLGNAGNSVTLAGGTLLSTADLTATRGLVLTDAVNTVAVADGTTLTWNGIVSSTGPFIKAETGTLVLGGNNTFTGATTVGAGTVQLTHANALGGITTGTSVSSGATLQIGAVAIPSEPLTISGTGVGGNGVLLGSGTGSCSGPVTLVADCTLGGTGNATTLSGVITGGYNLTKSGSGTWALSGESSDWSNALTVGAGTLVADLTSCTKVLGNTTGTTTVQDGATLRFTGGLTSPESVSVTGTGVGGLGALQGPSGSSTTGPTCSGAITLTGTTTMGVTSSSSSASLKLSGAISGAFDLTFLNGVGDITLLADNSAFPGNVLLSTGKLYIGHANALGDTVGTTTVTAGATIYILGGVTVGAEPLVLNGSNLVKTAILATDTYEAHSTWQGPVTLSGPCYTKTHEQSGSNLNLTLGGVVSGTGALIFSGPGQLILNGNNTYAGETILTSGSISVGHDNGLGSIAGGTTVLAGSNLLINTRTIGAEALYMGGDLVATGTNSWAGPVTLIAPSTFQGSGTVTISGGISGGFRIVIFTGTYLFTGTNTFSGGVMVRGNGTLGVGAAVNLGDPAQLITLHSGTLRGTATFTASQPIALETDSTIAADPATTLTLSGVISGSGRLTKTLTGTAVLTGANTYSGGTTISSGTLQGSTASLPGNIIDNAALIFDQAVDSTYVGTISGTGTVSKSGAATLALTTAHTYSGTTTVSAGSLDVAHAQALGTIAAGTTVSSGAVLQLRGVSVPGEGLTISGTGIGATGALLGSGSSAWTGNITMAADTTIGGTGNDTLLSGVIGGAFALSKAGSGSYTLSGPNNYTGATNVTAGTLVVNNALGCGTSAGGVVVSSGATLELGPVAVVTETLSLNGTGVGGLGALVGEGAGSWSGNISLAANSTIGGTNNTTTLSGVISGAFALTKTGSGTLITNNAGSTYSGNTVISQGTWRASTNTVAASSNGPLGNSANAVQLAGGTLEVDTATFSRGLSVTASGSRLIAYGADRTVAADIATTGTRTLSVGGGAWNPTLSGVLGNGTGTLSLQTVSPSITTLSNINTYTGSTTVQGGTLQLTGQLTGTTALTIAGGGVLDLNSSADCLPNALNVSMQGGTLQMTALTATRTETVGVLQIAAGANQITLSGSGAYSSQLTASGGYSRTAPATLLFNRTNGSPGTANLFLTGVADQTPLAWSLVSQNGTTSPGIYTTADGLVGQGAGDIVSAQSGNWNDTATWVGGVVPVAGNTVTIASAHVIALNGTDRTVAGLAFTDGGSLSVGNTLTVTGGGITVSGTGSPTIACGLSYGTGSGTILQGSSGTLTISGAVSGSGDLVKLGSGVLVLSGTNTCGGAGQSVVVGAGTLSVGVDAHFGAAATTVTLAGGTLLSTADLTTTRSLVLSDAANTMAVAAGTTLTWNGVVSGNGAFTKTQAGTLTLAAANTFTGTATISAGTLIAAHASALGTTAGGTTVASGTALQINAVAIVGETLILSGSGIGGNGALLGSGSSSWSGTVTLAADSTLGGDANTTTLSGAISGSYALTKVGTGIWVLGAANTHSGATTVSAGTLAVAHAEALGSTTGATSVASGATLRLDTVTVVGEGLTLNGTGVGGNGALLGVGVSGWTGTIAMGSDSSLGGTGNTTLLSGIISGGFALTKDGTGTFTLTGANTYSGATAINAGTFVAGHATATGTTAGGVTVANGATLLIDGVTVGTEALAIQGSGVNGLGALQGAGTSAWTGSISLSADAYLGGTANTTTLSTGVISGAGGLIKIGSGSFILSGANTFTGDVTIRAGTLIASANVVASTNGPFGNSANAILLDGGTLGDNTATFSRAISVIGDGSVIVPWTSSRTMAANITTVGARTLTLGATPINGLTLTGVMSDGTGALSLNIRTYVTAQTNHTLSGSITVVNAGTLNCVDGCRFPSVSALMLYGGNLIIDENNTSPYTDTPDRFPNTMPLSMRDGAIGVTATTNENRPREERFGDLNIIGGNNVFSLISTNYQVKLTFLGTLTQSNGGVLIYNRINSSNSSKLYFTGVADGTILPWTTVCQTGVDGPRVGVYTSSVGLVASSPIISTQGGNWDDTATWLGGVVPATTDDVTIASNHAVALNGADRQANTLTFTGGGSLTGANTLTVAGGAVFVNGSGSPTIDANLAFGAVDAQIIQNSTGILTVNGAISGTGNLGCLGVGAITLTGTNTFGGATKSLSVGSSTLTIASDANLGDAANTLIVNGSHLIPGNGFTSARAISVQSGGAILDVASGWTATLSGAITGTGALGKRSAGSLILGGNSSYSGTTTVEAGTLTVQHANALGSTAGGTRVENGASLILDGIAVGTEALTLIGTGVGGNGVLQASGTSSWAGAATLGGVVTLGGSGTGTLGGILSGAFNLTKAGSGAWTLGGNNSGYTNAIAFLDGSSGRLVAAHDNALGTNAALTVTSGDTLELSGASIPAGKTLTLSGTGNAGTGCLLATGAGNGWAGPLTLAAAATFGGTGSGTISGSSTGAFALTKEGAGSWILSGSNAFSSVTINAGTLRAAHASALGTSAGAVTTNNATLEVAGVTLANPAITMNNGSVLRGVGTAGVSRAITLTTGGTSTFGYSSATDVFTISAGFTNNQGALIIDGAAGTAGGKVVSQASHASWSGSLNVKAYATLEANGNINALGVTGAGTVTVEDRGTLRLVPAAGGTTFGRSIHITGDGVDGNGALIGVDTGSGVAIYNAVLYLDAAASLGGTGNSTRLNAAISGDYTLTKRGSGTWKINEDNPTWNGDLVVAQGTLGVDVYYSGGTALGTTVGTTTVLDGASLWLDSGSNTVPENITIIGSGVGGVGAIYGTQGSTTAILSGAITLTGNATIGTSSSAGAHLRITGNLVGGSTLSKVGPAPLSLTADNSAFTGSIDVQTGTLYPQHNSALGDTTGTTTVRAGATLSLGTNPTTLAEPLLLAGTGVSGSGALAITSYGITCNGPIQLIGDVTVSLPNTSGTINSLISDDNGARRLTKIGGSGSGNAPRLTAANTYGGGTTISNGNLIITNTQALGMPSPTATVIVQDGGCLQLQVNGATLGAYPLYLAGSGPVGIGALLDSGSNGTTTALPAGATLTLTADATIGVSNSTHTLSIADAISGSFVLSKINGGILTLAGDSSGFTGATMINAGTVKAQHANALGTAAGTVTVASGANLTLDNALIPTGKLLSIAGTGISSAGALIAVGTSSWGGPMTLTAATSIAGGSGTSGSIEGILSGAFDLTKIGAGTWRLAGDNAGYSNLITLSAGRLVAAHANALGTNAALTVPNNCILELAGADVPAGKTLTISGNGGGATTGALIATGAGNGWGGPVVLAAATTIGGTGSGAICGALSGGFNLTKCSAGTWTLAGDNSGYANTIAFQDGSSGRLVAGHNNALGTSAALTVTSGDTLELSGASIPAGKTLTLNGTGNAGTGCLIATGTCIWAGGVTLGSAATLGGTGAGSITGNISGAQPLTKEGGGSWAISGTNSSTTTTINNGIFAVISPGTAGSGTVTVNTGGTLAGTGTIPGSVTVAGGTVAPGTVAGSLGTLTVTGSLGGSSGTLAMAMSGASADCIVANAGSPPVTLSNLGLVLSGLPTATVTLLSFPNGTHATTFTTVTGLHPACTGPGYLTNSVVIYPPTLDLVWTGNCTGSGTVTDRLWILGNLAPSAMVSSASGYLQQIFELRSDSSVPVDVTMTSSDAVRTLGGGTNWIRDTASGMNRFVIELKPAGGAWADLTVPRPLVSALAVGASKALDLRFTVPTASTDADQKAITITATATVAP